jgi:predicted PurR-regulated permease PerM
MKSPKRNTEDKTAAERGRAVAPLDSGETRAIMVGAVILAVFLYFIKLILLPFVLAAIVAYICTPLLDWAARRTKWPRILFAVGLFLILVGVTGLIIAVAAKRLIAESTEIAAGLQGMLENFVRQAEGDKPVSLFGLSMNTHDLVQNVLVRVRDWIGQTDQIELLVGYSFVAFMGAFLAVVLLFYFLADGKRVAAGCSGLCRRIGGLWSRAFGRGSIRS